MSRQPTNADALATFLLPGPSDRSSKNRARKMAKRLLGANAELPLGSSVVAPRAAHNPIFDLTTSAEVVRAAIETGGSAAYAAARCWHKRRGLSVPAEVSREVEESITQGAA